MLDPRPPFEVRRLLPYVDTDVLLTTASMKIARRHAMTLAANNPSATFGVIDATGAVLLRVPERPRRSQTRYFEFGVRGFRNEDPDRSGVEVDLDVLCRRFGSDLVANLLRVHAGANRVISLQDFVRLNTEHIANGSVEHERNLHFAALQILGVFRETAVALGHLNGTGIKRVLTDPTPWLALQSMQRRWSRHVPEHFRSSVLFHLGFPHDVRVALERKINKSPYMVLFENDLTDEHLSFRFSAGEDLLLMASGLRLEDIEDIVEDSLEDMKTILSKHRPNHA